MSFNILSKETKIDQSLFLEASAGTGKTFAIQHLVVRLLISSDALTIDQIVIVTFTKKATRMLKLRIRETISRALVQLKEDHVEWEYLQAYTGDKKEQACHRLSEALFAFESASISTIHSFAAKRLGSNILYHSELNEGETEPGLLKHLVMDFLSVEFKNQPSSIEELANLLKMRWHWDLEKLIDSLVDAVERDLPIYLHQVTHLSETLHEIRRCFYEEGVKEEEFLSHIEDQLYLFKGVFSRDGSVKAETKAILRALELVLKEAQPGLKDLIQALETFLPANRTKRGEEKSFSYERLFLKLENYLPELKAILKGHWVLSRLASYCRRQLAPILSRDIRYSFDSFLKILSEELESDHFLSEFLKDVRVLIVDEFQDTDPIQWSIFKKLYQGSEGKLSLFLVGDPKQSIYAFRQADIYTYLEAAKVFEGDLERLDCNYRSHPSLIEGLNLLFSQENLPSWMGLPRSSNQSSLPLIPMKSPELVSDTAPKIEVGLLPHPGSQKKSTQKMIEYVCSKIRTQVDQEEWTYGEAAVLVSDHNQAKEVQKALEKWQIPSSMRKLKRAGESYSLRLIWVTLEAFITPKRGSTLRLWLSSVLVGFESEELEELYDFNKQSDRSSRIWFQIFHLHHLLVTKGFSFFYGKLMQSKWKDEMTFAERMVALKLKSTFAEWDEIAQYLIEQETKHSLGTHGLIKELESLQDLAVEKAVLRRDINQDSVQIVTIHASKGLEYRACFCLGLVKEQGPTGDWLPVYSENRLQLFSLDPEGESSLFVEACDELDAEKARRLYVAATRAKDYLFIPLITAPEKKGKIKLKRGFASPSDLLAAQWGREEMSYEEIYKLIRNKAYEPLLDFLNSEPGKSYFETVNIEGEFVPPTLTNESRTLSLDREEISIKPSEVKKSIPFELSSFTKLSQELTSSESLDAPEERRREDKMAPILPKGAETGILIHSLFEKYFYLARRIPNFSLENETWLKTLSTLSEKAGFGAYQEELSNLISKTLSHKLKPAGFNSFTLSEIDPFSVWVEKEFLFPEQQVKHVWEGRYFKGFIDLIFRHQDQVYILDWKSNYLGADGLSYGLLEMTHEMEKHRYDLQAKLYSLALYRFLQTASTKETFGGAFYLFVRGPNSIYLSPEKLLGEDE